MEENPRAATRPWYKENEFYEFHRQSEHKTNGCMLLKHEIHDLIDDGRVSIGAPPNQYLGIFNNPFPNHDQSEALASHEQDYHEVGPPSSYAIFVG